MWQWKCILLDFWMITAYFINEWTYQPGITRYIRNLGIQFNAKDPTSFGINAYEMLYCCIKILREPKWSKLKISVSGDQLFDRIWNDKRVLWASTEGGGKCAHVEALSIVMVTYSNAQWTLRQSPNMLLLTYNVIKKRVSLILFVLEYDLWDKKSMGKVEKVKVLLCTDMQWCSLWNSNAV